MNEQPLNKRILIFISGFILIALAVVDLLGPLIRSILFVTGGALLIIGVYLTEMQMRIKKN